MSSTTGRRFVREPAARDADPCLNVMIGDRWAHVTDCLAIVHDGFVESGFMSPQESGLRVIPEYRNPGTSFIVCYAGAVPVGSAVVVGDGPYGLPSDRAFGHELAGLRQAGSLAEAGSLAVARSHRRHVRPIVQRLFIAIYEAARRLDCATIVIAGNPSHLAFWSRALNFELVGDPVEHFGAEAICLATDLERYGAAFRLPRTPNQRAMAELFEARGTWLRSALGEEEGRAAQPEAARELRLSAV